jgi:hypothetical protein
MTWLADWPEDKRTGPGGASNLLTAVACHCRRDVAMPREFNA